VDWSTNCFCCERVLQKRREFGIAQREFGIVFGSYRNRCVSLPHVINPSATELNRFCN
jgi:hypothetical protein